MLSIRTILHPTDFSEPSGYALNMAYSLAADYGAHLVIIHVMATPVIVSDGILFASQSDLEDLREKLDRLAAPDAPIDVVRRLEEGNPTTEILHMAQLCHADLIVMGSHGQHGLRRWLMGSVAEDVLRKATCPVLTVTTPAPADFSARAGHREAVDRNGS